MIKQIEIITYAAAAALLLATLALPAHAGTLSIYNKNCATLKGFKNFKRVTVHVYGQDGCDTDTNVTVKQGESKTITLDEYYQEDDSTYKKGRVGVCKYAHEALGTVSFKADVRGTADSSVTCRKDWLDVCQCTKD